MSRPPLPSLALVAWILAALGAVAAASGAGGTYPTLEVSFTRPPEGNPFDYNENDVRVRLQTPDGIVSILAFWDGDDTWRARHAPTRRGRHAVQEVTVNGEPATVGDLALSSADPDAPAGRGFVRLSDDGRRFAYDDASPYYPLGYNLAWHTAGRMPPLTESLATMGASGVNWTRMWMNHWDAKNLDWVETDQFDFPQPPLGELSLPVARRWDAILAAAEEAGIALQMVLQHHGQYSTSTNPNWDTNPWNAANGGFLESPIEFFTSERARELTKQKYRYIVARYGHSPAIMAWELFNEVQYTDAYRSDDPAANEAVYEWHEEMAAFLREQDVYDHLVTTSSVVDNEGLWRATDYYQAHIYPPDLTSAIDALDAKALGKAYFYGEIGGDWRGDDPSTAGAAVHELLWASVTSQSAGAAQYWYWDIVEPIGLLSEYAAVSKFLDRADARGRPDLAPVAVAVEAGEPVPLTFGPGLDWAASTATEFVATSDGRVEGAGGMSAYLQGDSNREMFPEATFRVNFPQDGTFAVEFGALSTGGAAIELAVDGVVRSTSSLAAPRDAQGETPIGMTLSTPVAAGEHVIGLKNVGPDWIKIAGVRLSPYAPPLAVRAKGNGDLVMLWASRRQPGEATIEGAALLVPNLAPGQFSVEWIDTCTGDAVASATAEVPAPAEGAAAAPLRLSPPPIATDIAAVIRRIPPPQ